MEVKKSFTDSKIDNYRFRGYRSLVSPKGLSRYRVRVKESDLLICTKTNLKKVAMESLLRQRKLLEKYAGAHPDFIRSFNPIPASSSAPEIVIEMARAAERFGVGPMAAVAGAIADFVGRELLTYSSEVIVENGGDIFSAGGVERKVRIFSGDEYPLLDIVVEDRVNGIGICTSSARIGPSVSLGVAEAVTVIAQTATIADAAATFLGNMVKAPEDIDKALEETGRFPEIMGAVIAVGGKIGFRGDFRVLG